MSSFTTEYGINLEPPTDQGGGPPPDRLPGVQPPRSFVESMNRVLAAEEDPQVTDQQREALYNQRDAFLEEATQLGDRKDENLFADLNLRLDAVFRGVRSALNSGDVSGAQDAFDKANLFNPEDSRFWRSGRFARYRARHQGSRVFHYEEGLGRIEDYILERQHGAVRQPGRLSSTVWDLQRADDRVRGDEAAQRVTQQREAEERVRAAQEAEEEERNRLRARDLREEAEDRARRLAWAREDAMEQSRIRRQGDVEGNCFQRPVFYNEFNNVLLLNLEKDLWVDEKDNTVARSPEARSVSIEEQAWHAIRTYLDDQTEGMLKADLINIDKVHSEVEEIKRAVSIERKRGVLSLSQEQEMVRYIEARFYSTAARKLLKEGFEGYAGAMEKYFLPPEELVERINGLVTDREGLVFLAIHYLEEEYGKWFRNYTIDDGFLARADLLKKLTRVRLPADRQERQRRSAELRSKILHPDLNQSFDAQYGQQYYSPMTDQEYDQIDQAKRTKIEKEAERALEDAITWLTITGERAIYSGPGVMVENKKFEEGKLEVEQVPFPTDGYTQISLDRKIQDRFRAEVGERFMNKWLNHPKVKEGNKKALEDLCMDELKEESKKRFNQEKDYRVADKLRESWIADQLKQKSLEQRKTEKIKAATDNINRAFQNGEMPPLYAKKMVTSFQKREPLLAMYGDELLTALVNQDLEKREQPPLGQNGRQISDYQPRRAIIDGKEKLVLVVRLSTGEYLPKPITITPDQEFRMGIDQDPKFAVWKTYIDPFQEADIDGKKVGAGQAAANYELMRQTYFDVSRDVHWEDYFNKGIWPVIKVIEEVTEIDNKKVIEKVTKITNKPDWGPALPEIDGFKELVYGAAHYADDFKAKPHPFYGLAMMGQLDVASLHQFIGGKDTMDVMHILNRSSEEEAKRYGPMFSIEDLGKWMDGLKGGHEQQLWMKDESKDRTGFFRNPVPQLREAINFEIKFVDEHRVNIRERRTRRLWPAYATTMKGLVLSGFDKLFGDFKYVGDETKTIEPRWYERQWLYHCLRLWYTSKDKLYVDERKALMGDYEQDLNIPEVVFLLDKMAEDSGLQKEGVAA